MDTDPITLFLQEDREESQNFNSIRRIRLTGSKPVRWQTNEGIIRNLANKGTTDGGKSGVVPTHLRFLYHEAANNRPEVEQEAIVSLLQKYLAAFSASDTDLGLTQLMEHTIDTGEAKPVKQPQRRAPLAFANDERKAITQMLDQGIIQKSNLPLGSPLQLVV